MSAFEDRCKLLHSPFHIKNKQQLLKGEILLAGECAVAALCLPEGVLCPPVMALLFSGAVTSSPIRKRESLADQSCHSFSLSLLSPDLTYECFSINPLTGSPCSCRRSPRLLSNGYYVLTEDSYVFDDDGNVSLTPSKTNVSYKENLGRIFRRRRRSRRSLASLFGVTSSWLESSVFEAVYRPPLGESSWSEESTPGLTKDCDFIYDHSTPQKPGHASCLKEQDELSALDTEACFSKEQFSQSLGGFLDVPPPSPFNAKSCCHHKPCPSDSAMVTAFFLIFLTVSLFTALFSRSLLAGVAVGSITFTLILTSFFLVKSTFRTTVKWARAKTEDISSRNE